MNLSMLALQWYATWEKKKFIRKTHQIKETQTKFLFQLLRTYQDTELGRQLNLRQVKTVEQFRQQVPIWSYNQYEPYIERIAAGEKNILTCDPVVYINLTSGTTGKKKQIPVTRRFQRSLQSANLASVGFLLDILAQEQGQIGKILMTNSAKRQGFTGGNIEYGPVSVGSIRKQSKVFFRQTFSFPFEALLISDTFTRHYICLLFALRNETLRGMVANFPMLLLRTCRYLEDNAGQLIQDLETGHISPSLQLEPELRTKLAANLRPAPERAAQLRNILDTTGKLTPETAWPNLSYIITAMGGTSGFYLEQFPAYFGNIPVFGGVYGTAEGHFGIYHQSRTEGCILAIDSGFFEFMPRDQWESTAPKTLLPSEVTVGEYYRILVTSYSGIYRYDIGDVVEVVGFYNQTPLIVFRHRHGGLLSSTTEKTTEFHVVEVLQKLQQEFELNLDDFCITLSNAEFPSRYLVNIELAPGSDLKCPQAFLDRFDYWMGEINTPYRTVRQSDVPAPQLRILSKGSFSQVRNKQVERGMFDSQLKIPHITEDRHFLADLSFKSYTSANR